MPDLNAAVGHLDNLTISRRMVAAAKPRRRLDAMEYRRAKLIANIEEQIELSNLALAGKQLILQRKRGHGVVNVRPRIWWQVDADGTLFTQIRYNKLALTLDGRGASIEVPSLKKLTTVYRTVIRAIEAGELDRAIEAAARKSKS